MESTIVTTKGQVVIPYKIRRRHGIKTGMRISFIEKKDEIVLQALTDEYIDSVKGSLKTNGKALKTLAEDKKKEREY